MYLLHCTWSDRCRGLILSQKPAVLSPDSICMIKSIISSVLRWCVKINLVDLNHKPEGLDDLKQLIFLHLTFDVLMSLSCSDQSNTSMCQTKSDRSDVFQSIFLMFSFISFLLQHAAGSLQRSRLNFNFNWSLMASHSH